jgi:DNA-binding transcriptional MerR regulator
MLTLRGKQAGFTLVEIKELIDLYDTEDGPEKQRLPHWKRAKPRSSSCANRLPNSLRLPTIWSVIASSWSSAALSAR